MSVGDNSLGHFFNNIAIFRHLPFEPALLQSET